MRGCRNSRNELKYPTSVMYGSRDCQILRAPGILPCAPSGCEESEIRPQQRDFRLRPARDTEYLRPGRTSVVA